MRSDDMFYRSGPRPFDGGLLPPIQEVVLERTTAVAKTVFEDATLVALSNLEFRYYAERQADRLVFELRAHLASEELSRIDIKYPKDWWQAFRERWFPRWLLKRYPVQYHEEHYSVKAFYPRISLPREHHYVRILKMP